MSRGDRHRNPLRSSIQSTSRHPPPRSPHSARTVVKGAAGICRRSARNNIAHDLSFSIFDLTEHRQRIGANARLPFAARMIRVSEKPTRSPVRSSGSLFRPVRASSHHSRSRSGISRVRPKGIASVRAWRRARAYADRHRAVSIGYL